MHWRAAAIQSGFSTKWSTTNVRKGKRQDTKKRNKSAQESKGSAVIPYVEVLSETAERIFRIYGINTAMKPYRTLRQLLVHPKDQRTVEQTGECVYRIPCHNYNCTMYIYWRDWQKLWEKTRGIQKRSRID